MASSARAKTAFQKTNEAHLPRAAQNFQPPARRPVGNQAQLRQLQAKLSISRTNDPLEHEADAAADRVMRMADAPAAAPRLSEGAPLVQREATGAAAGNETAPPLVHAALKSPGTALDSATQGFMADRFGADFSDVRIHSDAQAARSADAVEANAYTVGRDIVFGAGKYDPVSGSGRRLIAHELAHVMQQGAGPALLQRDGKAPTPKPVAGGNILYIGMNAYSLELKALRDRYWDKRAVVTGVTRAEDTGKAVTKGGTFDLTTDAGIDSFAATLGLDAANAKAVADLLKKQPGTDRDDLAHVIDIYAQTNADGIDRMTRVVLSGHSYGKSVYGHAEAKGAPTSHIEFDALVALAGIFPKAAGQTRHLMVSACFAGAEGLLRDFYLKCFPNLQTFTGYTWFSPTNEGSARDVANWARKTDTAPTKLDKPSSGRSNWTSAEGYKGDEKLSAADTMSTMRSDEAKFNEYLAGTRVDPKNHEGWLADYYGKARLASQDPAITGADHDYAQIHADQAFRLRFWKAQVAHFWLEKGAVIRAGYGGGAAPDYGKMKRSEALLAIAAFPAAAKGSATEIAAAKALLDSLQKLDPNVMSGDWLEMP